jgi:hypothetical protein
MITKGWVWMCDTKITPPLTLSSLFHKMLEKLFIKEIVVLLGNNINSYLFFFLSLLLSHLL